MRLSQFWQLMDDEFGGAYARTLAVHQSLPDLGGRTADEALTQGVPPRQVWDAVCEQMQVPIERRLGIDRPAKPGNPD
ncbi:hypothetical protein BJY21_004034 [Kineosphaera limosa]|uniref:DUF3046 domain-containing protein n=1 Tax=Kineosphaera limosa NBRC 100340 TaxID=1184609 RepID=K6W542_9MICO|nr:DUF3046 domain-containing protein [Kineosphaera limosa]NYE02850.1 hypothetical protein [Kineosphaera limosa]GAB94280.1 hypothetical protein KILIM_004_00700 [Kineosphaera limosa NBRC 100340]